MSQSVIPGEITHPSYKWRPEIGLVSYGAPFDVLAKAHIERLGGTRVLIIVSGSLAKNTKEVEKLEETLSGLVVAKRVGMKPHSDWQEILDVTEQAYVDIQNKGFYTGTDKKRQEKGEGGLGANCRYVTLSSVSYSDILWTD
jgi:hypothetical protein